MGAAERVTGLRQSDGLIRDFAGGVLLIQSAQRRAEVAGKCDLWTVAQHWLHYEVIEQGVFLVPCEAEETEAVSKYVGSAGAAVPKKSRYLQVALVDPSDVSVPEEADALRASRRLHGFRVIEDMLSVFDEPPT